MKRAIFSILAIFLFEGCHLGPVYHPPSPPTPEEWKTPQGSERGAPDVNNWWEVFQDDVLNCLETQALENNPSLYATLERVVQARAVVGVRRADLYPNVTLDPSYTDWGTLFKIYLPSNTIIPGFAPLNQPFRAHEMQYTMPFDLNYQVDLWGKIRGQYESAFLTLEAQEGALLTAMLTLTTDLAGYYFQLRTLDAQIDYYQSSIDTLQKNLSLNQSRFNQGLATYIDVTEASLLVTNMESDSYEAIRQRTLLENAIAVLIGQPSSVFYLSHRPLQSLPPTIPAGLPSDILLQRPDLLQAERTLASQHALIGVAYASFLPSLSLTGTLGYSSPDLKDFLQWKSRYWLMGANIGQTIFDAGRNCSNLDAAWAGYRVAKNNYQQQVLIAFREVDDSLNNLEWQLKQYDRLKQSVDAAKKSTFLSLNRYKNGLTTYLEVVNSEQSELVAERNEINLLGASYGSTIQLIKALGGSWPQARPSGHVF